MNTEHISNENNFNDDNSNNNAFENNFNDDTIENNANNNDSNNNIILNNTDENHFHDFIFKNNTKFGMGLILFNWFDVNTKNFTGMTRLHTACIDKDFFLVNACLMNRANIDEKDNDGCTPLHYACAHCDHDIIKLLLEVGANVNEKNNHGFTPLYFVFKIERHTNQHSLDAIKLLLDHNANIYETYEDVYHIITINGQNMYINYIDHPIYRCTLFKIAHMDKNIDISKLKMLEKEEVKRIYILSLVIQIDTLKHYIIKKLINLS